MWLNRCVRMGIALCVTVAATSAFVRARIFFNPGAVAGPGMVSLPQVLQDNLGNNWRVFQGGWFQQNNNMPLYSQGAMLMVDGQNPNANVNTAKLDAKTGEIIFENLQGNGCTVTRRVYLDKAGGYIRYIDSFKNTQNA